MLQQPDQDLRSTSLRERVVIVTGGASGLGAAVCQSLALAGAHVVIGDLDDAKAQAQAAILSANGSVVHALALDVGDPAAAARAVAQTLERFGRLDVLINNAGTDLTLPIDQIEPHQWCRIIDTNLNGAFYMAREAAIAMRRNRAGHSGNGYGHIINIASTAAKRAWPNASAYHASKWGLLGLSHALHAELRSQGIKVTAVVAGGMRTPFLLDRFPDLDLNTLQDPASVAAAIHSVLMMPEDSVIAEITVLPVHESSWP